MSTPAQQPDVRVLFVCLGNICRSPSAEGVMRAKVSRAGLEGRIELDSAGTGDWHVGEAPDPRAREAASARGFELDSVARQVQRRDFDEFDLIVAMDTANLRALRRLVADAPARAELRLLREFEPGAAVASGDDLDVPDPYYGGVDGFDDVLDLLEASCEGLLDELARGLPDSDGASGGLQAPDVRG